MTDPFSQPYVFPGADRPKRSRPRLGKIVGWVALVVGVLFVLASLIDFSFAGLVVGLCAAAAGGLYLFADPSKGRIVWATPAIATLPALIAFGISTPTPEPEETPTAAAFAAPAIADVSTTTARPTTTVPTTTAPTTVAPTTTVPTTVAPTPETVPVYVPPPTTEYAPAPAPAYVPEPEPVYVPPAPVVAEAPSYVSYANCAAVRAAGAAPIYRGEPGYSSKLDRDGDGVGCE
ncbi:excalibur calcium-binding domain-containing protein [Rhodococcoides kyotonense]|uniref:Excalibur calcium-binding domain-containing protein n=1 Tax=Rhodococcoides kyotonense TaxID=398843 RepID=A0A239IGI5_9NOCA|nr:excalibur calcium-binding domain-containing protein [Rhodococcus kyotonensis]SNS92780.1 Excalibur calcium-binding domain-containing protein [Rhodococcus kyotonensis]